MLSYTISLLRKAPFKELEKQSLWSIFSTIYLDMYDMALYMGFAIYLAPQLLPHVLLYKAGLIFSLILLVSQLAKVTGFIHYNMTIIHKIHPYGRLLLIAGGYLGIFFAISGSFAGPPALLLFIFCRILQGYSMGHEIGAVINFASASMSRKYHNFLYYVIALSSELGALIAIFFNRLLVTHDIAFVINDKSWVLQTLIGAGFTLILALMRFIYPLKHKSFSCFTEWSFIETIKNDGISIFLRATVILCHVLLIFVIIFRIPTLLHLGLGWSIGEVNRLVLYMAGFAFLGTNTVTFITKVIKPFQIIRAFFLITIGVTLIWLIVGNNQDHYIYSITLYAMSYVYGVFIRVTPLYLYHVKDMHQRKWLISRYLAYIFSYSVLGPLSVLMLDFSHFIRHAYYDDGPPIVLLLASLIGLIGLFFYSKRLEK